MQCWWVIDGKHVVRAFGTDQKAARDYYDRLPRGWQVTLWKGKPKVARSKGFEKERLFRVDQFGGSWMCL